MLQNIRDGVQGWLAWVIVGIISVPFAFWGINEFFNPSPKRIIAEVNGVEILEADFQREFSQRKQQLRSMFKDQNMDLSYMDGKLRQDTLQQMIEEELLVQSAVDSGMRIGDILLAYRIHSFKSFQNDDDKFDQERYKNMLRYNMGLTPSQFENIIRRSMLAEQFRNGLLSSAIITDYAKQQHIQLEKQQRLISYLVIPFNRFIDNISVSDSEIDNYYTKNKSQYMTNEKVSIEYVELSKADLELEEIDDEALQEIYESRKQSFTTPPEWNVRHILTRLDYDATAEDLVAAEQKSKEISAKIKAGEDFAELAKQYSDDTNSKNSGGNLNWLNSDSMIAKPFEKAVMDMEIKDVSEPIKTRYGFHIIELLDKKAEIVRTFKEVRDELIITVQQEKIEVEFDGIAGQFSNLAFEQPNSLSSLVDDLGLKNKSTQLFSRFDVYEQSEQHPILANDEVISAAFSNNVLKDGYNSEPIEISEQHAVVIRLKDHEAATLKPLEEVKDNIIASIKLEQAKIKAKNLGQSLFETIKLDNNIQPQEQDLTWSIAEWFARKDNSVRQKTILEAAFKMGQPSENNVIYQNLELKNGDYALIAVLQVKDGENKSDEEDKSLESKQFRLQQAMGITDFNQFISHLKTEADITNYSKKASDI
ncbi:MAG: SurA N-terminal domain-containing protein [Thiomargarita sp.]|nr:SurA N-terminal domain-containing protein [Thiomargarita sp.]